MHMFTSELLISSHSQLVIIVPVFCDTFSVSAFLVHLVLRFAAQPAFLFATADQLALYVKMYRFCAPFSRYQFMVYRKVNIAEPASLSGHHCNASA